MMSDDEVRRLVSNAGIKNHAMYDDAFAKDLISDEDLSKVILSALFHGPKDEIQLDEIIDWAHRMRLGALLLQMAINGRLTLDWNGSDVVFHVGGQAAPGSH